MQRSVADRAEALPPRLAGDVNNDMLRLDDHRDHSALLVLSSTQRIARERCEIVGVTREHGESPRPARWSG